MNNKSHPRAFPPIELGKRSQLADAAKRQIRPGEAHTIIARILKHKTRLLYVSGNGVERREREKERVLRHGREA